MGIYIKWKIYTNSISNFSYIYCEALFPQNLEKKKKKKKKKKTMKKSKVWITSYINM